MNALSSRNIVIGALALILLVLLGYFAWQEHGTSAPPASLNTSTTTAATSSAASTTPPYTITQIPIATAPAAPDYKAPLQFSASSDLSADDRAYYQQEFAQAQALIEANPVDFNAWIQLGIIRKEAGDYAGAAADWQYMSELYPTNVVSFGDLADLYTNFWPNSQKAAAASAQEAKNKQAAGAQ